MIYNKKKKKKSLKPRIQQGNSDVGLNFSVPSRLWDPLLPTGQQHHNILEYIYTVHILIHVHVSLLQRPCKCKKQQWIFNWPPINRNCFFLIPFFCHLYHSVYSVSQQLEPITLHEFFFFFLQPVPHQKIPGFLFSWHSVRHHIAYDMHSYSCITYRCLMWCSCKSDISSATVKRKNNGYYCWGKYFMHNSLSHFATVKCFFFKTNLLMRFVQTE